MGVEPIFVKLPGGKRKRQNADGTSPGGLEWDNRVVLPPGPMNGLMARGPASWVLRQGACAERHRIFMAAAPLPRMP
jgi:hypothetical protein